MNPVFCLFGGRPSVISCGSVGDRPQLTPVQALGAGAGVSAGTGGAMSPEPDDGAQHDGAGAQQVGAGAQQVGAGAQQDDLWQQLCPQPLLQHFVLQHFVLQHLCLQHPLPASTSALLMASPTTATTTAASDNSLRVISRLLSELKYVKIRSRTSKP